MANKEQQRTDINIELKMSEDVASGKYSNLVIIHHSQAEFVFDFTKILPAIQSANVESRVIMTPQHAKLFLMALGGNINKYELANGEIPVDNQQAGMFGLENNGTIN